MRVLSNNELEQVNGGVLPALYLAAKVIGTAGGIGTLISVAMDYLTDEK